VYVNTEATDEILHYVYVYSYYYMFTFPDCADS
jgi:hypothetical protein